MSLEEDEERCERAFAATCRALAEAGLARRVESADDARWFVAAGVASVVEHRFGETLDAERLEGDALTGWIARATARGESWGDPRERRGALIVRQGARKIGTIELEWLSISRLVWVSNLYVVPDARGHGIASALLDRVHAALAPAGAFGLAPSTHWSWPRAVRFYLRHGATLRSWKHALAFVWRRPGERWWMELDGDRARFTFESEHGDALEWRASREDGWLRWDAPPRARDHDAHGRAEQTFALALATHGWPLARSPETLERRWTWSDGGMPEGLAAKIEIWEAWDRDHGFRVDTPRIPRLAYRDYRTIRDE